MNVGHLPEKLRRIDWTGLSDGAHDANEFPLSGHTTASLILFGFPTTVAIVVGLLVGAACGVFETSVHFVIREPWSRALKRSESACVQADSRRSAWPLGADLGVTNVSQVGTDEGGFGWYHLDGRHRSGALWWFHADVSGCLPTYLYASGQRFDPARRFFGEDSDRMVWSESFSCAVGHRCRRRWQLPV